MNANNNPLNIKGSDPWKGKLGNDARGHCRFKTPEEGARANWRTLESKWLAGKRTLLEIIEGRDEDGDGTPDGGWAPASDTQGSLPGRPANNPHGYALGVASRVARTAQIEGLRATEELPHPKDNVGLWCEIFRAMARVELGYECPWSVVLAGAAAWIKDFVEGKGA